MHDAGLGTQLLVEHVGILAYEVFWGVDAELMQICRYDRADIGDGLQVQSLSRRLRFLHVSGPSRKTP